VQHLTASAGSFAGAEAANTALLQPSTAIAGAVAGASTGLQDLLGKLIVQLQNSFWNALFSLPYPIQAALGVGLALIILALLPVFALINSVFGTRILEGFWI
jgi:hypothetical protein